LFKDANRRLNSFVPNLEHSVPANPLQFAAAPHYLADIDANVSTWRPHRAPRHPKWLWYHVAPQPPGHCVYMP